MWLHADIGFDSRIVHSKESMPPLRISRTADCICSCQQLVVFERRGWSLANLRVHVTKTRSSQNTRTIRWKPTSAGDDVLIKFCLEEEFWGLMDDIAQAKLRPTDSSSHSLENGRETVYANFCGLALSVAPGILPIQRVQDGWPDEADMTVIGQCWCEE